MNNSYKILEQKDAKGSTKEMHIEIAKERVNDAISTTYDRLSKNVVIPGFRAGKAPRNLIEAKLGANLYEEALNRLIPQVANEVLIAEKLSPLDTPHFHIEKFTLDAPIVFGMTFSVYPTVTVTDLNDVHVTKGKLTKEEEEALDEKQKQEKLEEFESEYYTKIMREVVKHMEADIPQQMIDREAANREQTYRDRIASIGLNLDDFLQSKKTSLDELRKEWEADARFYVEQELFFNQFANDEKIEVTQQEVDDEIKKLDPQAQEQFANDYSKEYVRYLLRKQKAYQRLLEKIGEKEKS